MIEDFMFRDEQDKEKETEEIRCRMKDDLIELYECHFGPFDPLRTTSSFKYAPWTDFIDLPDGYEFPKRNYFSFYILEFRNFIDGYLSITAGLIDCPQLKNRDGHYELAILIPPISHSATRLALEIGRHYRKRQLNHNDLVENNRNISGLHKIGGFVARKIKNLRFRKQEFHVLCLVGLTHNEMAYARKYGTETVIALLGEDYLMTEPDRKSCISIVE